MHRYISTGTKILIFICIIISAYLIFTSDSVKEHIGGLGQTNSYISFFFAGILFALGFTLPISAGLLLSLNGNNLMLSVLLGGAGSVIGDLIIIAIAKKAFAKEFIKIEASREYHIAQDLSFLPVLLSPANIAAVFSGQLLPSAAIDGKKR